MTNPKFLLLIVFFIVFSFSISFCQVLDKQDIVEIPFSLVNEQIIVNIKVRKKVDSKMILSFSFPSSIEATMFQSNKMSFETKMYRNNLYDTYTPVYVINEIELGDFRIGSLDMYWDGILDLNNNFSQRVDGILGSNFFDNRIIQIDFDKKVLRIFKNSSYKTFFNSLKTPSIVSAIIPFDFSIETPPKEKSYLTTQDILIDGNKKKVRFSINDSSMFHTLNNKNRKATVKIGDIELKDVPIIEEKAKKYEIILGTEFFKNFVTTFNFKDKKIVFEKK